MSATDFLNLTELFSDEQKMVSETVRDFVQKEVAPRTLKSSHIAFTRILQ